MKKLLLILPLIPKLGFWNVAYAAWYKISLKFGWRKRLFPLGESIQGPFFKGSTKATDYPKEWEQKLLIAAEEIYNGTFTWFSYHKFELGPVPNWFYNPFEDKKHTQIEKHWTEISDFGERDIKIIWELSRFDWLTTLARAYKVSGDNKYLERLNELLNDWSKHNPLNQGPNWKCGQEASFRLMKLLTTAQILDQLEQPTKNLKSMIEQHATRIYPNIRYALAQENNHSTSECIGIYIAAVWLMRLGYHKDLKEVLYQARTRLERCILKLVLPQGTFSQLSTNYHRVFLDTMSFCVSMMDQLREPPFAKPIANRLIKAGEWQYKMTFGENGDVPNFGSNDGAMIETLHCNEYRDFRPSTQLFFATISKNICYNNSTLNEPMYWRIGSKTFTYPTNKIEEKPEILDKQILVIKNEKLSLFLKIPHDTFRQGNDAFHVDVWIGGQPLMIDSGTYSYNSGNLTDRFKSVASHNTVQFGNHEQMPKIGRFLNGKWIVARESLLTFEGNSSIQWSGTYKDFVGNIHQRKIVFSKEKVTITDHLNTKENSIIRYQFAPTANSNKIQIPQGTSNLKKGMTSLFYLEKAESQVLEISPVQNSTSISIDIDAFNIE